MGLTDENIKHLRRPYTAAAVKWRPDGKPGGTVRAMVYIDSSLVVERLSEVDPNWTADYQFLGAGMGDPIGSSHYAPTVCRLTVLGLTRSDIGGTAGTKLDAKAAKSAYSDALKRAASRFHVGAYLRALPVFWIDADDYTTYRGADGKDRIGQIKPGGVKKLRAKYREIVTHTKFVDRFGEAIDYGDVEDDSRTEQADEGGQMELAPASPQKPAGRPVRKAGNA